MIIGAKLGMIAPAVATVTYTDKGESTSAGATQTFLARAIGAAAANRDVFVCVSAGKGTNTTLAVSSMTIQGISAGLVVAGDHDVGGNTHIFEIWKAAVPTLTTADVVVTINASVSSCGIAVFSSVGAAAAATATATNSSDPMNASINVPSGGFLIGYATWNQATPPTDSTWTNLTQRLAATSVDASFYHTAASDNFAASQTGLSVTNDPNAALTDRWGMVLASFGPA